MCWDVDPPALWTAGQCYKGQSIYPTAGQIFPICAMIWKGLTSPGPFCTFLPSLILMYKWVTTTYRDPPPFPKIFSNGPPPPSILLLCHCQGFSFYTSFESLQKRPNQSPLLQDGLYKINTYCPNSNLLISSLYFKNSQKNKTTLPEESNPPRPHCTSILGPQMRPVP